VASVEIRGTGGDLLHRVVRSGRVALRRALEEAERELPRFVWRELERFLACGDPEQGFAWLVCDACADVHRLVPFSCKTRAFCPACGGRRMAERAAAWCDDLFPFVAHRQWVVTVPWARRRQLAFRPELARGVLRIALEQIFAWLSARAEADLGVHGGRSGAVTVEQRFSSSLALNLHFHSILPDGVWARDPAGQLQFHRVRPTRADLELLVGRIAERCEGWLDQQVGGDDEPEPDDAQAVLLAASAAGRVAAGERAGQSVRRFGVLPEAARGDEDAGGRGVVAQGYSLHAGTWVAEHDRSGLERLARYLLRPPLARGRLEERPDGQLVLHLRKPWRDGTSAFLFTPQELVEKLAALVIRPRVHTTHFHGVFAANAAWREEVVVDPAELARRREADAASRADRTLARRKRRSARRRWSSWCPWSDLLERVFGHRGLNCPSCGRTMRLRAVVVGPPATTRILAGLARFARGPPPTTPRP